MEKISHLFKKGVPQSIAAIQSIILFLSKEEINSYDEDHFRKIYKDLQEVKKEGIKKDHLIKHNINLNLFFNLLFTTANKQKVEDKHINTFNLYMLLIEIFPFEKELLQNKYNPNNKLFHLALSCHMKNNKIHKLYKQYTSSLTKLTMFDENELFDMYQFYYCNFFLGDEPFKIHKFSKFKVLIDLFISFFINNHSDNRIASFNKINVLLIIESYIDVYLSYVFKSYCVDTEKKINQSTEILVSDLLKIIKHKMIISNMNPIILEKLLILLCLLYFYSCVSKNNEIQQIITIFVGEEVPFYCEQILFEILNNYDKLILKIKTNKIDTIFFEQNLLAHSSQLYSNSMDNESLYDYLINNKITILKGCLTLIKVSSNKNQFKSKNQFKRFSFMQCEECFYKVLQLSDIYEEIICLLYFIVKRDANSFIIDEWEDLLKMIIKIIERSSEEKKRIKYFNEFVGIIELLIQHNNNEQKLSSSFIDKLFTLFECGIIKRVISQTAFDFFIRITFNTSNTNVERFIEPCFIQYLIKDELIPPTNNQNPFSIIEKNNVIASLQHFYEQTMNTKERNIIELANDEKKKKIIDRTLLKYYNDIIENCTQILNFLSNNNIKIESSIASYFLQIIPSVINYVLINTNNISFFKTIIHNIIIKDVSSLNSNVATHYLTYQKEIILKQLGILNDRRTKIKLTIVIEELFSKEILNNEDRQLSPIIIEVMLHLVINIDNIILVENLIEQENQIEPCLKKLINKEDPENENYIIIDINLVIKKVIIMLNQNITLNQTNENTKKERESLFKILNRASSNINMLSKENFSSMIKLILLYTNKYNQDNTNLKYCFSIISNFNFLLNSKEGDKQANNILNIENDTVFKQDLFHQLMIKVQSTYDAISNNLMELETKKSEHKEDKKVRIKTLSSLLQTNVQQFQYYLNILIFYLYSTINNSLILNYLKVDYAYKSLDISDALSSIIDYIFNLTYQKRILNLDWIMFIMSFLFNLRNLIRFTPENTIIKCMFLLFYFGRNKLQDSSSFLKTFDRIVDYSIIQKKPQKEFEIPSNYQHYFYHLCDITILSYLCCLEKESNKNYYYQSVQENKQHYHADRHIFQNLVNQFGLTPKQKENRIFLDLAFYTLCVNNLIRDNLSNEDKQTLIKELDTFEVIKGQNELVCVKEIEYSKCVFYILSPISNIKYTISFDNNITEQRNEEREQELLLSLYKGTKIENKEPEISKEQKTEISPLVHTFLSRTYNIKSISYLDKKSQSKGSFKTLIHNLITIPVYLTYNVNVLMYKAQKKTVEDFINFVEPNEISSQFIKFISVLGVIKQNLKNEFVPSYKDYFYNIEFNLCNTNKSREEKNNQLNYNSVNIIWVDSPISSIDTILSLFNSYNSIQYSLIIVYPETDTHYHIKVRFSKENQKIMPFVQTAFLNDYIINIKEKSGVQYFSNNLIGLCEWAFLNYSYQEFSNGKIIQKYNDTNFIKRYNHIDSFCNEK